MITIIDGSNMLHRAMYNVEGKVGVHPLREIYCRFLAADPCQLYIVWDGKHANARRRCIYSGYKQRPDVGEDIKASFDIIKKVLVYCPVTQIEVPTWEADDVIYTVAKEFAGEGKQLRIETNDSDFYQFYDHPNIEMPFVKPLPCEPMYTRLYKALVGDQSDSIPGWRGFGPKRFEAMKEHYNEMMLLLELENYEAWAALPWPKGTIPDYGTFFECCTYFKVVTMQIVPEEDFLGNVVQGISAPAYAESVFAEWRI